MAQVTHSISTSEHIPVSAHCSSVMSCFASSSKYCFIILFELKFSLLFEFVLISEIGVIHCLQKCDSNGVIFIVFCFFIRILE